ncbi:zinc finger, CCHC-type containing protein [Tanacetum coccineum]
MTPELHRQFENSSPYDIIKELKSMFEKQARVERFDLIQTFHACKQVEGKPIVAYVLQMKGYVDQLERLGYMLPHDLILGLILNGLTKDFAEFVRNYNMHNMGKTIGELHAMLIEYEKGEISNAKEVKRMQNVPYASVVDSIMYAIRCARPDVAFAQNITSRFQQNPGKLHWIAVKSILKYLRNTKDMFLSLWWNPEAELRLIAIAMLAFETDRWIEIYDMIRFVLDNGRDGSVCKSHVALGIAPMAIIDRQLPFEYTITSRSTDVVVPISPVLPTNSEYIRSEMWYMIHNEVARLMLGKRLGYVLPQDLTIGLILNGLTSDFAGFVRNYNMHNMGKTIGEQHAMLIEYEKGLPKKAKTPQVMMIKGGKIQKSNQKSLKAKGKGKANGKRKDKQIYIPKPKNPKPSAKEHPTKDDTCHHYKKVGHCKRNCPAYLAELIKKKKQVGTVSSSDAFII